MGSLLGEKYSRMCTISSAGRVSRYVLKGLAVGGEREGQWEVQVEEEGLAIGLWLGVWMVTRV